MGRKRNNLTGQRFGRLLVIEPVRANSHGTWYYRCKCDCGNEIIKLGSTMTNHSSCGCYAMERNRECHATHAKSKTRLFHVWMGMKQRCYNKRGHAYHNYGGRGITVCDEWKNDFVAFETWAVANGYDENAEKGKYSLDRIDVNGNYEPSNCRFISMSEQAGNKRNNVLVDYKGETKTIAEWARETGLTHSTIRARLLRGWDAEKTLTTPILRKRRETAND